MRGEHGRSLKTPGSRRGVARWGVSLVAALSMLVMGGGGALAAHDGPGDENLVVPINDSEAGGTYPVDVRARVRGTTVDGTPVYIYVPEGAVADEGVDWMDPAFDPNPGRRLHAVPVEVRGGRLHGHAGADRSARQRAREGAAASSRSTRRTSVRWASADAADPASDALVVLVYNVQDAFYYDCDADTYTAGYFAPEYIATEGMNVIVIDAFDWANRIGDQTGNPDGQSELYEGVIAHELEHLLMNYSDPGELSWVDEGLADFAIFLNGYDIGGSHLTYHQVFHRETSLTRWGGGLENYGASFTFFLYLWEQAGRQRRRHASRPDGEYDGAGGDLLIKLIFEEQADGMEGVQNAIDAFNAQTGANLRSAEELFKDWAIAVYLDAEGTEAVRHHGGELRRPGDHDVDDRDRERPVLQQPRHLQRRDAPRARCSTVRTCPARPRCRSAPRTRSFRKPGPTFRRRPSAVRTRRRSRRTPARRTGTRGYESQADNILDVDVPRWTSAVRPSTSGPGTSSRRAGTSASSRRWSAVSG